MGLVTIFNILLATRTQQQISTAYLRGPKNSFICSVLYGRVLETSLSQTANLVISFSFYYCLWKKVQRQTLATRIRTTQRHHKHIFTVNQGIFHCWFSMDQYLLSITDCTSAFQGLLNLFVQQSLLLWCALVFSARCRSQGSCVFFHYMKRMSAHFLTLYMYSCTLVQTFPPLSQAKEKLVMSMGHYWIARSILCKETYD